MFSADLMVADPVATATTLVERLGLPALRDSWTDVGHSLDELLYLRAYHPMSEAAPTVIEVIARGVYAKAGRRPAALVGQAVNRPVQTHATVLITKHFDEMTGRLRAEGIRHYEMPDLGDGLRRCWLGVEALAADDPDATAYDADADGGLFLEVISWEGTALATRGAIPVSAPEGGITRIVARTYLVPDAAATIASLRRALGWPGPDLEVTQDDGIRYATLRPAMESSAALELVQPLTDKGRHGEFFSEWGLGPHAIRFGVNGLGAKAEDLTRRGTPFSEASAPNGDVVLVVEGDVLGGVIAEFAEDSR